MQKLIIIVLVLAGCAASAGAAAVQRIRLDAPLVNPPTTEAQGQAADLLDAMAGVANRLYGDRIQCAKAEAGGSFDYSLSLIAILGPDNPSVVMHQAHLRRRGVSHLPVGRPAHPRAPVSPRPCGLHAVGLDDGDDAAGVSRGAAGGG